jgi:4'-phosphopantetheinyl transferase
VSALHAIDPGAGRAAHGVELSLWWADLDAAQHTPALPAPVRARAARFVRDSDRQRYLASHAVLQDVLGTHDNWVHGANGKPALAAAPPHFNLSRRDGVAAVAVSRTHEVGIDVETLRAIDDASELAALHFTQRERESVVDDADFLRAWTRKEACMKATGLGLSLAPSSFECGAQPVLRTVQIETSQRQWTLLVHTPPLAAPIVVSWAVVLA